MAAKSDELDDSVWQGYVSAIACLLLALLLLMSILSMAIVLSASAKKAANAITESQKAKLPSQNSKNPPSVFDESSKVLRINFGENVIALQGVDRNNLTELFSKLASASGPDWYITAYAERHETRQQRTSYLRLLSIRALMIASGIKNSDINISILDSSKDSMSDSNIIYISRHEPK